MSAYGHLYLDRLIELAALDRARGGAERSYALTREAAKYLANAMAYDDVIRVADLKTRSSRFARVRSEARAKDDQVLHVTEFMHPRVEEICGTMPARLGKAIEARPKLTRALDRIFNKGRHVRTDGIFWFMALYSLAGMRRFRRALLRHEVEEAHIAEWLASVRRGFAANYDLGVEIVRCRRLIKGYSDTQGARREQVRQGAVRASARRRPARRRGLDPPAPRDGAPRRGRQGARRGAQDGGLALGIGVLAAGRHPERTPPPSRHEGMRRGSPETY